MSLFDRQETRKYIGKEDAINIIDGTNMFCRACSVDPKNPNDLQNTVGIFIRMFAKTLKTKPKYCAVVFDSGRETFRHKLYPLYKSNRHKLYIQDRETKFSVIKDILHYSGFKVIDSKQYEADDIIGSLARICKKKTFVRIFSEDKDFVQLVRQNVILVKGGLIHDEHYCKNKYGISSKQFIDYLALIGDSIDCIPGVDRWGKKSAAKYLSKFGSISEIKKQKLSKSLSSIHTANTNLLQTLVKIKTNIRVIKSLEDVKITAWNADQIVKLSKKHSIYIGDLHV